MLLCFILTFVCASACALINPYPRFPQISYQGDPGPTLILTPYLEAGKIDLARKLSKNIPLKGNITSFSGFFNVDKQCDSNMFFWFFPAASQDWQKAPVLLWLQGGPGATSLYGLFTENGPIKLTPSGNLKKREYSWSETNNVLYIDNPVGTGYSFTNHLECYSKNETHVGQNLYQTLLQFFTLFPELQPLPFFVTGESYAGKYVPAISYTIHKNNPTAKLKINLKGLAIGNGLVDPGNQLHYGAYLYQLGLIDINERDVFQKIEDEGRDFIAKKNWTGAFDCFDRLLNGDQLNGSTIFRNVSGFSFYFNYLYNNPPREGDVGAFVQKLETRRVIHVGKAIWHDDDYVEKQLMEDVMQSVLPWLVELLDNYHVLIYNGQLDIIVAYPLTLGYLQKMEWSGAAAYKTAPRYKWYVENELAGYAKHAGNLTEVLVRNAGHMVPGDQPKWAFDLINRFVNQKSYNYKKV